MNTTTLLYSAAWILLGTTLSWAAEPTLKVGDSAPKLQTGQWVQGEPVREFKKGTTYIVEFWATWCGPCRVSIPHLNEVHQRYKDKGLIVIGQDCWEQDTGKVEPFIKQMGDKMTYRVALDDPSGGGRGKMADTWMAAAGQDGIPAAFIVDSKGIVAWIGHPMDLKDDLVDNVLSGKHDLKKAQLAFLEDTKRKEEWRAAMVQRQKVFQAIRNKDWAEVDAKMAEAAKTLSKENMNQLRLEVLLAKGQYDEVQRLAGELYPPQSEDERAANPLNEIAWRMALDPQISADDLARAEKLARQADTVAGGKSSMILDTLARIRFRQNQREDAIALQQKAVRLADEASKASLEQTLDSYRKGNLPKAN
jgi:thiol-disulfide isomerase/thioredoxin